MRYLIGIGLLALLAYTLFLGVVELSIGIPSDLGDSASERAAVPASELELVSPPAVSLDEPAQTSASIDRERRSVADAPEPTFELTGSVHDDLGTPLFAYVVAEFPTGVSLERKQIAPDGSFRLSGFRAGVRRLWIDAPGHAKDVVEVEFPHSEPIEFELQRLAVVTGRVITAAGEPVPDALVIPRRGGVRTMTPRDDLECSELGRFELGVYPEPTALEFQAPGFVPSELVEFEPRPGERIEDVLVRLDKGGVIEGLVHPLVEEPGVTLVTIKGEGYEDSLFTDSTGRFRHPNLTTGTFKVTARPRKAELRAILGAEDPAGANLLSRSRDVEVVVGETVFVEIPTQLYSIVRVQGDVTIGGRTAGPGFVSAQPVAEDSDWPEQVSDSLSEFSEDALELYLVPGTWRITVTPIGRKGRLSARREVWIPPVEQYRLDLDIPAGSISGRAYTVAGEVLSDIWIHAEGGGDPWIASASTQTGVDGTYEFESLPEGVYELRTSEFDLDREFGGPSVIDGSLSGVRVESGAHLHGVDFVLNPGGGVRVEVHGDEADFEASVLALRGNGELRELHYSGDGAFIANDLPPGTYEVMSLRGPLRILEPITVEVVPGRWGKATLDESNSR